MNEPAHWNYWAREGLAFEHGIVTAYEAGGIFAPELAAVHHDAREIVMLLDRLEYTPDGWPRVATGTPSVAAQPAPAVRPAASK